MILVESMPALLPCRLPICSRLKSFTSDVLQEVLSVRLPSMTLAHHQSPTATRGIVPVELQHPPRLSENRYAHVLQNQYTRRLQLWVRPWWMRQTWRWLSMSALMVVHLNWAVHVNVFPLIGSQKRFITRGEYRSAAQATEKKFNSDLMSCRLEI